MIHLRWYTLLPNLTAHNVNVYINVHFLRQSYILYLMEISNFKILSA